MLNGWKTYVAATAAVLIAVGAGLQALVSGEPIQYQLIVEACIALAMIFLRQGIKKTQVK